MAEMASLAEVAIAVPWAVPIARVFASGVQAVAAVSSGSVRLMRRRSVGFEPSPAFPVPIAALLFADRLVLQLRPSPLSPTRWWA